MRNLMQEHIHILLKILVEEDAIRSDFCVFGFTLKSDLLVKVKERISMILFTHIFIDLCKFDRFEDGIFFFEDFKHFLWRECGLHVFSN